MSWLRRLFRKAPAAVEQRLEPALAVKLPPSQSGQLSDEQLARKQATERLLIDAGVRINPHLPAIESEAEIILRSASEVARRLVALVAVAAKAGDLDQDAAREFIDERGLVDELTPLERDFINDAQPSERDRIQFSWRFEAAHVLLWSLGWTGDKLGLPTEICDAQRIADTVRDTRELAIQGLRPASEILDEADVIYRCHWAARQSQIDGNAIPAFDYGVIMERHHALNWLISYGGEDWDDVTTDT